MATLYATFSDVMGGGAPVYAPASRAAQKITTSGSSQALTYVAVGGEYVALAAVGGPVAIAIAPSATAVSGAKGTHFIVDGQTKDIGPLKPGDVVAVIDA